MDNNCRVVDECFSDGELFQYYHDQIYKWGVDRNITREGGATALSQIKKLKEEVQELEDALIANDKLAIQDAIGDVQVVLFQVCRLRGEDLVHCLGGAYDEIKDRKGRMENGVFVKENG